MGSCTLPLLGEAESAASSSVSLPSGAQVLGATSPHNWGLVLSLWRRLCICYRARVVLRLHLGSVAHRRRPLRFLGPPASLSSRRLYFACSGPSHRCLSGASPQSLYCQFFPRLRSSFCPLGLTSLSHVSSLNAPSWLSCE